MVSKPVTVGTIAGALVGFAAALMNKSGFYAEIDPSALSGVLSEASQSEMAKYLFLFTIAAWIHSGRVKTEIAKSFDTLIQSINSLGSALRQDLEQQREILKSHAKLLEDHSKKINNLESHTQK